MTTGQDDTKNINFGIREWTLTSWTEFVEFVKDKELCWSTLIYRGQANADWKVTSTLDRLEQRFPTTPNPGGKPDHFNCPRVERKIQIDRFKEMARGRLAFHIPDTEEDEWWALAQHHGMATPMLDWAYSPFVALYFAFEEETCDYEGIPQKLTSRAIFALTHQNIPSEQSNRKKDTQKHPKPFAPRWPGNYRLNSQGGLFLKMPDANYYRNGLRKPVDLEAYVRKLSTKDKHSHCVLQKFTIPNSDKDRVECLRFLDYMNINRASLFPDLDGAAQYVNNLWEVNWDKTIGHINDTFCRPSA
jgi:hypothetical protein